MSFASVCLHTGSLPVNTCTPFKKYTHPSSLPLKLQISHEYRKTELMLIKTAKMESFRNVHRILFSR